MQRITQILGSDLGSIVFNYTSPSINRQDKLGLWNQDSHGNMISILITTRVMLGEVKDQLEIPVSTEGKLIWIDQLYYYQENDKWLILFANVGNDSLLFLGVNKRTNRLSSYSWYDEEEILSDDDIERGNPVYIQHRCWSVYGKNPKITPISED